MDDIDKLKPYKGKLDYMVATISSNYDIASYASLVKPGGFYTQLGMPVKNAITCNNLTLAAARVNMNASLIGGIPETQEMVDYCAANKIYPQIQVIRATEINEAWDKVVNKKARYRYVIDAATI